MQKSKIIFLTEWTPAQFKIMERAITKYFSFVPLVTNNGTFYRNNFSGINELLGLAYTSSGIDATYSICNVQLSYNEYKALSYERFVMDEENVCYAILQDKEEKETIIRMHDKKVIEGNLLLNLLNFEKCREIVNLEIAKGENYIILCPNYSINSSSIYEGADIDPEQSQWDFDELADYLGKYLEVSQYDDLIVDLLINED